MTKTFKNELGNEITITVCSSERGEHFITISGPNSTNENILTRKEALELTRLLVEFYTH